MLAQFFGKPFLITLSALAGTFLLAILVFPYPLFAGTALISIFLATGFLSYKRPELGLLIAFAELFANSHGHLIFYEIDGFAISLRMTIFLAVMLAWLVSVLTKRVKISLSDPRLIIFIPLFIAIAIGFAVGFTQNSPLNAFKDGNAYLYLAYLFPVLTTDWNTVNKRLLLQVMTASATWALIVTLGLLYIFTHFPEWMLSAVYTFIRDTRTGELTKMAGNIFRIFLQAQLSLVFMAYLLSPFLFLRALTKRVYWQITLLFTLILSVILISLSRSFWVGMIAGDLALITLVILNGWPGAKVVWKSIGSVAISCLGAGIFLVSIVLFPLPYRVGSVSDLTGLLSDRTTDTSDVAISSRWNLLPPLMDEIRSNPIVGSGFGEEVTFKTDDPRARAINPDGTWTTYSLEWGWLEMWLKMGILAPIAFVSLAFSLIRGLLPYLKTDQSWLGIGLISCLVMLFATHVFSPYLNHPLGLGFLLFVIPFLKQKTPELAQRVGVGSAILTRTAQASVTPSISE